MCSPTVVRSGQLRTCRHSCERPAEDFRDAHLTRFALPAYDQHALIDPARNRQDHVVLELLAVLDGLRLLARHAVEVLVAHVAEVGHDEVPDLLAHSAAVGAAPHAVVVRAYGRIATSVTANTGLAPGGVAQLLALEDHAARSATESRKIRGHSMP